MKKFMILFLSFVFLSFASISFADDLNLTFDDDSDLANWSHWDEGNVFTAESWDATGGVDGGGGLKFTDGGFTFLVKRPVTAVAGTKYSLTIDVNVDTWGGGDLALSVQGLSSTDPSVIVSGNTGYNTYTLTGIADANDSGYVRLHSTGSSTAPVVFIDNVVFDDDVAPALFISEYAEGSSSNKYIEIYNASGAEVDLSAFSVQGTNNGTAWGDGGDRNTILTGTLAAGAVYILAADAADPIILALADTALAYESPMHHNGDDGIALLYNGVIIDAIGVELDDPGTAWDVAGVVNATKDHTLVRKSTVTAGNTDWASSAGTDADNSEWVVLDNNTWDYLGSHPHEFGDGSIMVTLRVNLSTNLDTITTDNGFVEVRGALNNWTTGKVLPDSTTIDWNASSDLDMVNVGGDYWEVTFKMLPEDTLRYKFYTGFGDGTNGTAPGGGWEGPFTHTDGTLDFDTRAFISGQNDTVEVIQYYNPDLGTGAVDQFSAPFESKADSVAIYFRVNMAGQTEAAQFDPATEGPLGMRGDPSTSGGTIDWGETRVKFTRETNSAIDGSFWSGVAYFAKDSVTEGSEQQYKYFVENGAVLSWESVDNRTFNYPSMLKDTTIAWNYWDNQAPTGKQSISSIVTWRVSTEALESVGLFDRGVGDKIEIRGPKGWSSEEAIELFFNPLLQEWTSANEEFTNQEGAEISYKYFVAWDSSRADEASPNYIANLDLGSGWEEPAPTGGGNRVHVFQNAATQTVDGDFGFDRQFFNGVPANGVFNHDMDITFNIDMSKATDQTTNTNTALFRPGTDTVWVQWSNELLGWTQGIDINDRFLILTDPDQDNIYSGTFTLGVSDQFPNNWYQLGYVITYSTDTPGQYVTNGGGFDRGRRYYQYIHPMTIADDAALTTEWPAVYDLETLEWTETDLFVEDPPNLTTPNAIIDENGELPSKFALEQNYPNPFNPSTTITYQVPKNSDVKLTIFNIMGQEVLKLVDQNHNAGKYEIVWNAQNNLGKQVASGVYYLKFEAGNFVKFRKMTLLR
jgi:Lamin Tail Domain/FlgD Ig-like domain